MKEKKKRERETRMHSGTYRQRPIRMLCMVLYVCKRKRIIIMFDHEILYHVEREKEKLTKLSSTKKKVDELVHSIKYKMTFLLNI
jgi:hypothetical protein